MASQNLTSWTCVAFTVTLCFLTLRRARVTKTAYLPPGPRPLPLIGNILDLPRRHIGEEFMALSNRYGDIVHLHLPGRSIVILGSQKALRQLADKGSSVYSDRPSGVMTQLTGLSDSVFVLMDYGQEWRRYRRAFHQSFGPERMSQHRPFQIQAARRFLRGLAEGNTDLGLLIKFTVAAIIVRITYGIELQETTDEYFNMMERVTDVAEDISVPGRYLVEAAPVFRFLPSWLPGMQFKRYAADAKRDIDAIVTTLLQRAREGMQSDSESARDSVVARVLDDPSTLGTSDDEKLSNFAKVLAITAYIGGADTSNVSLRVLFLAMALYPDVQRLAQAELDRVIGTDRLPDFSDRPSLPYINAIVKELLRWHPALMFGVPHCTAADDECSGYFIPKGSIVLANVWGISRDCEVYPDPERFEPGRFLDEHGGFDVSRGDPADWAFGFGRRICPGRDFAEASMFIFCASILHAFDIHPPVDEYGIPMKLEHDMTTTNTISHPEIYNYRIKPRSLQAEQLVKESS